jgi:hypothetical protein
VPLNCALLGGSLVLYGQKIVPSWVQGSVILCFFASLVVSSVGMLPAARQFDLTNPEEIRAAKNATLQLKILLLRMATFFLVVGFLICIITIPFGGLFSRPGAQP